MSELTYLLIRPTPQTSRLIRTPEASLYLGVSPKQLRRLVKTGQIPIIVRGNVHLYDVRELDAFIDRQNRRDEGSEVMRRVI